MSLQLLITTEDSDESDATLQAQTQKDANPDADAWHRC